MKHVLIAAAFVATAALGTAVQAQEVISIPAIARSFIPTPTARTRDPVIRIPTRPTRT
jgi:hypothetical protein